MENIFKEIDQLLEIDQEYRKVPFNVNFETGLLALSLL